MSADRRSWPLHQPIAPDAPIPGRHWYGGCDDLHARVGPDGVCEGCGETACPVCGAGFYGPRRRGCQCSPATVVESAAGYGFQIMTAHHDEGMKAPGAAALAALEYGADANAVLASMNEGVQTVMAALRRTAAT